jgi:hypothetical protein
MKRPWPDGLLSVMISNVAVIDFVEHVDLYMSHYLGDFSLHDLYVG